MIAMVNMVACKSRNEAITDEFKKVDSSLQSIKMPVDSIRMLHMQILAKQQANPHLAVMADSMFVITSYAIDYMDSLKQVLVKMDSTGETPLATNKVFANDRTGKLLYSYLIQVHYYAGKVIIDKGKLLQVNNIFAEVTGIPDDRTFVKQYFANTPGFAARTILIKLHNDCYNACVMTLADVAEIMSKIK